MVLKLSFVPFVCLRVLDPGKDVVVLGNSTFNELRLMLARRNHLLPEAAAAPPPSPSHSPSTDTLSQAELEQEHAAVIGRLRVVKPFTWQIRDLANLPNLKWGAAQQPSGGSS